MSSSELDRPAEAETIDRPSPETRPWKDALKARLSGALAVANSRGLAALSALLLLAVLVILLSSDRSVLSGTVVVAWGALACFVSYQLGAAQDEQLTGLKVVIAYAAASLVLFLVMNGLYRLFGA